MKLGRIFLVKLDFTPHVEKTMIHKHLLSQCCCTPLASQKHQKLSTSIKHGRILSPRTKMTKHLWRKKNWETQHLGHFCYCWWFRNPANQLRLVVYPTVCRALYITGGWEWDFWTINSIFCPSKICQHFEFHHHHPCPNLTAARSALGILDGTINRTSSLLGKMYGWDMGSWFIHKLMTSMISDLETFLPKNTMGWCDGYWYQMIF